MGQVNEMAKSKIERYKDPADYSPDEVLADVQAQRRGDERPRFETDEYRQRRREALEAAGLEDDDPAPTALEDMSAEQHHAAIRGRK